MTLSLTKSQQNRVQQLEEEDALLRRSPDVVQFIRAQQERNALIRMFAEEQTGKSLNEFGSAVFSRDESGYSLILTERPQQIQEKE